MVEELAVEAALGALAPPQPVDPVPPRETPNLRTEALLAVTTPVHRPVAMTSRFRFRRSNKKQEI